MPSQNQPPAIPLVKEQATLADFINDVSEGNLWTKSITRHNDVQTGCVGWTRDMAEDRFVKAPPVSSMDENDQRAVPGTTSPREDIQPIARPSAIGNIQFPASKCPVGSRIPVPS